MNIDQIVSDLVEKRLWDTIEGMMPLSSWGNGGSALEEALRDKVRALIEENLKAREAQIKQTVDSLIARHFDNQSMRLQVSLTWGKD